jgi:hypothetical protein
MTPEQLAQRIRRPVAFTRNLLEQERKRGNVVRRGKRWRLSAKAERAFGVALRSLPREQAPAA